MQQKRLQYLLDRYGADEATQEECAELENYLQAPGSSDTFEQVGLVLLAATKEQAAPVDTPVYQTLLHQILSVDIPPLAGPSRIIAGWQRWAAVAAVILVLATGAALWFANRKPTAGIAKNNQPAAIEPGRAGAILTLADGTQVVLDSADNGTIATQNGASIVLKNKQLLYNPSGNGSGEAAYNTMSTPKGRHFQVTLPDGTGVWLNSASSIRFPTFFNGKERKVAVTGEVYFEVAKQAAMPFKVSVNNKAEIEVLGTHFNLNGYANEPSISTTLLEGSVKVSSLSSVIHHLSSAKLSPGQQAQLTAQNIQIVDNADLKKVMAWKNGLFNFDGASLQEVMKQLERWYDIEVVYEGSVPPIQFFGKMSKDMTLTQLLDALKSFEVHFTIEEGKRLIIKK